MSKAGLIVLVFSVCLTSLNVMADADSEYKSGSDFAHQIKGQGENSLKNFNPSDNIPNYTDSPGEKKYYGGVTATGDGSMKADGTQQWTTNEATQAVTNSFINNPKEPISPDAPFIQSSQDVQSRADTIIGNAGQTQCEAQNITHSEFTNYTCERDLLVEQACTRTATIEGDWSADWDNKYFELAPTYSRSGKQIVFSFSMPETGTIVSANLEVASSQYLFKSKVDFMNTSFFIYQNDNIALNAGGMSVAKRQNISGTSCSGSGSCTGTVDDILYQAFLSGKAKLTLKMTLRVETRKWNPRIEWVESCPFSKNEGTLKKTECIEPGSTKTVVVEGKPYQITQACWAYKDTYMTQAEDAGSCKTYMDNPACTLASRQCAFSAEDGSGCLQEYATYSCETRTSGQVMICGGDTFCLDGECELAQQGKNNDFGPVVSALAALAAAGKDVSELNGVDVRAFTGSAKFCKKFAAGFSNCCKGSGWGQDIGLANCSTEEKALGKAKEKKLTISVGEFCSKKVLGVCLEKKRGYCQFDSKLAQIVQQQGRNGQLHIGFGGASSPDCRGITQTELQQIQFDKLDFSNFYEDLQNNKNIPDNNALTERIREQIASQLQKK